jgi:hypothetical protein
MPKARELTIELATENLKEEGFEIVEIDFEGEKLEVVIGLAFAFALPGPVIFFKVETFYKDKLLFEITGQDSASGFNVDDIEKKQEEIAQKLAKIFSEMVRNPESRNQKSP